MAVGLLCVVALACFFALAGLACFAQFALTLLLFAGNLCAALFFCGIHSLAVRGALAEAFVQGCAPVDRGLGAGRRGRRRDGVCS